MISLFFVRFQYFHFNTINDRMCYHTHEYHNNREHLSLNDRMKEKKTYSVFFINKSFSFHLRKKRSSIISSYSNEEKKK